MVQVGTSDATAFYMRHSHPCGHLRITAKRRECLKSLNETSLRMQRLTAHRFSSNSSASATAAARATSVAMSHACPSTPRCRLAVCVFGLLARYGGSSSSAASQDYDAWITETIAFPSLQQVLRGNGHCAPDVFVHTWETGARSVLIERLYKPVRGEYGARESDGRTGMFLSLERVLALRRTEEAQRGIAYDWVLCTRFDAVWMAPLPLRALNSALFYVAHWCVTTDRPTRGGGGGGIIGGGGGGGGGIITGGDSGDVGGSNGGVSSSRSCRPLAPFAPETHGRDGVPDYFFAAAPATMDAVFEGLPVALLSVRLKPTGRSCCNHAILASRLKSMGVWERLGRVLVHHMDIETLRSPKFEVGGRVACWQRLERSQRAARPGSRAEVAQEPAAACGDRHPGEAAHWLNGRHGQPHERQAALEPLDSFAQPSPVSRCPPSRRLCLCQASQWATHPALTEDGPRT